MTVIPLGHPETGAGGASHAVDEGALGLGVLALAAAATTAGVGFRRRRSATGVTPTSEDTAA
ncbi:hypothetical protein [uncultured Pseudonocardia sp.]|uniref:hypothetical protein n=1 Tax=uncultured Pseudonocardia sp. TaxID=211455 RepID=UPI0026320B11|nr:hypothetical protein [uncultured Pseudonocardia sp.]